MGLRPYNDPEYRAMRAWLTANPNTVCWFPDCNAPATTIDHHPALILHHHVRGTGCCQLHPACLPHNCGHGATLGNRMRADDTPGPW